MLQGEPRAPDVQCPHGVEVLHRRLGQGGEPRDARVQEEHVQPAVRLGQALEELRDLPFVSRIRFDDLGAITELLARRLQGLAVAPGHDHARAFRREPLGGGEADAGGATGDEGDLVLELSRHVSSAGDGASPFVLVCT